MRRTHGVINLATKVLLALVVSTFAGLCAYAIEPVNVSKDQQAIDISGVVEYYRQQGDSLKISTAPDRDGIVRRVEVQSRSQDTTTHWAVFALANNTAEQIDRLIVAPRYRLADSGLFWPDLDSTRIVAITPSEGFSLEVQDDRESDVFLITLDPGAAITLIAELKTPRLANLYLWEPEAYKETINSYTLYRGIVLGISGLLAVFLTILFVVKGTAMFPATAALAWGVLAYVCVDFGFWDRVMTVPAASMPIWRAGAEVYLSAALLIFLYAYLGIGRFYRRLSVGILAWLLGLVILLGVALVAPAIAAGFARFSLAAISIAGAVLIARLAIAGFDRAVMLIPTWLLAMAWVFAGWMTATGAVDNDIIQPALAGGLVLIVMLLGFTVMQHAFAGGVLAQGLVSDTERQALALAGSGYTVWDWDAGRDYVHAGDEAAHALGYGDRALNGPVKQWENLLHPNDRDRFRAMLDAIQDHKRGRLHQTFRIRSDSGQYHWFNLRARPLLGAGGEVVRCVGTISDVTDSKNAEERLLFDSVHDNLTGLENRQLMRNRLDAAMVFARRDPSARPSIYYVNIDRFREINAKLGFGVGDTILLTAARRLGRLLRDGDHLARMGSDQFAILLTSDNAADRIAAFADSIRRTLKAPVQFAGEDIELTASIGIATWTAEHRNPDDMMRDAELAMMQAKRFGGNRIEPFRPAFRAARDDMAILADDLREAINRNQLSVTYQPIVALRDNSVAGFEALIRWRHPRLGDVPPSDFIPIAERIGFINEIGMHVLETAARDLAAIHAKTGKADMFVSVNISSRELLRHDIVADIRNVLRETGFPPQMLRVEITESLAMENPENTAEVLARLKSLGIGLSLDDFGTGYSSLSYLLRFPFDVIKIDKSFIQARNRPERLIVLRSIIALGHGLGLKLVAEGIEFEADAVELQQLGCEFGQGYFFGEPMALGQAEAMAVEDYRLAGQ